MSTIRSPRVRVAAYAGLFHRALFIAIELGRSWISPPGKWRILFSSNSWENRIRRVFRYTKHEVFFGSLEDQCFDSYDLVMPVTIHDLILVSSNTELCERNPVPLPSRASVELCDDKESLNCRLRACGFGHLIPDSGSHIRPPLMIKKKIDENAKSCHLVLEAKDLPVLEENTADLYFFQEFITGPSEFATHILFDGKRITASLCYQYVFDTDTPIKGRDVPCIKRIARCEFLSLWSDVLAAIGFRGLCCVNYKISNGKPMLLEINPRFGASLSSFFFTFLRHLDRPSLRSYRPGTRPNVVEAKGPMEVNEPVVVKEPQIKCPGPASLP